MLKTVLPLLVGAVTGLSVTVYVAGRFSGDAGQRSDFADAVTADRASNAARGDSGAAGVSLMYLDAYQAAESVTDPVRIERRILELFAEPFSIARDAEIAALFERLAALDLGRAIRVAQTPGFDSRLAARVLQTLARDDADAAIAALAVIRNPALQVELAIAVLGALGNNAANLERIANGLPEYQRVNLQLEALAALARDDADGALGMALAMSDAGLRNAAAQRVGIEWARLDPMQAFEYRNNLPGELKAAYGDAIAAEWARLDSDGFLAFADTQQALDEVLHGLMHTIGAAPARTYEISRTHPPLRIIGNLGAKYTVEYTSFTNAAALDPDGYLAIAESMPEGQLKRQMVQAIAEVYGRNTPEEGVLWARARNDLQSEMLVVQQSYVQGFDRSFKLMTEFNERNDNPGMLQSIGSVHGQFLAGVANREELAARLLTEEDQESASIVLNQFVGQWAQTDAEGAFEWMLDNGSAVNDNLVSVIAGRLAGRDASRAATYIERLPPNLKQIWVEQVAPAYARQNPEAAIVWMAQFQGDPGYDVLYQRVVLQMAQSDPASAASILPSAPAELQQQLVSTVASGLAQQSLNRAAQWSLSLSDEAARAAAVGTVATTWAQRDPRAAQRWVVNLPRGAMRDQALGATLNRLSFEGYHVAIVPELLESFESEQIRDQGVSTLVRNVVQDDPDYAESMMEEWISNPVLRSQAEQLIAAARR